MTDKLTLDIFADFYVLQAIIADRRADDHPDLVGQARNELARISAPIASCLADYMYLICMGEARHAVGSSILWYWNDIPKADGRTGAYKFAREYDPIKVLPQLADLFGQAGWGGSYGGKKWKHIAEVALSFRKGELTAPVYIDHVADLKHNGGTQFSKSEVEYVIEFRPHWNTSNYGFSSFLTFKRDTLDFFASVGTDYFRSLSLPVGRLAIQYMQRLRIAIPAWIVRPPIAYEPYVFGSNELKNRVEISYSSSSPKPTPSFSGKKPEKLDDSMYLSEDEMYDPKEVKHDPKVDGLDGGSAGQSKPDPVLFTEESGGLPYGIELGKPAAQPAEIQETTQEGETKDEPTSDFAAWLVSASQQLP